MIRIIIESAQVDRALSRLRAQLMDMAPAMRDIAAQLESDTQAAFENQGQPGGKKWQALAPSTICLLYTSDAADE